MAQTQSGDLYDGMTGQELTNKATAYKHYSYTVVAAEAATDLQFYGYDETNYM